MKITDHQAKYFAYALTCRGAGDSLQRYATALNSASIDLNPHQVEAALFAFRSPYSNGAILADEVGLGKTIEAGLVIAQRWAERRRRILVITPASLRSQWQSELTEKFRLKSVILDGKAYASVTKKGSSPFEQPDIVICSYQFANTKRNEIKDIPWDLVVIDEAHCLRNVYKFKKDKKSGKTWHQIKESLIGRKKLLLTATPLQNNLAELYGLVSFIDEERFADLDSFTEQYVNWNAFQFSKWTFKPDESDELDESDKLHVILKNGKEFLESEAPTPEGQLAHLKRRLAPVCHRTLRSQVSKYISYTERIPFVQEFRMSPEEQQLYDKVSEYLRRPELCAISRGQRPLMTVMLRKHLASSPAAIAGTLGTIVKRLRAELDRVKPTEPLEEALARDDDGLLNMQEEYDAYEDLQVAKFSRAEIEAEIVELEECIALADSVKSSTKAEALLEALPKALEQVATLGGARKALIFTESRKTQDYLLQVLQQTPLGAGVVLFNGSNDSAKSKEIYAAWKERHKGTKSVTGVMDADLRQALVDYFREEGSVMIATEAGAQGLNLQFCSLVINYDLPWNPQRVEQRIGRCHRYMQKCDVVVLNFLNTENAADRRVYELLSEKFHLFSGVFGASDQVLGALGSGVDLEKRIDDIYQRCRTVPEIEQAFNDLQNEYAIEIEQEVASTEQELLAHVDEEVLTNLKLREQGIADLVDRYKQYFWRLTCHVLSQAAEWKQQSEKFFYLTKHDLPSGNERIPLGRYALPGASESAEHIYDQSSPLALGIFQYAKELPTPRAIIRFDYSGNPLKIAVLEPLKGASGWLKASLLALSEGDFREEHLVLAGVTDKGAVLESEVCEKLLTLSACDCIALIGIKPPAALMSNFDEQFKQCLEGVQTRQSENYDLEAKKLEDWADDVKISIDAKIRVIEQEGKKDLVEWISNVRDDFEKARAALEMRKEKRNVRIRELRAEADQLEDQKFERTVHLQQQLVFSPSEHELFVIRWSVT